MSRARLKTFGKGSPAPSPSPSPSSTYDTSIGTGTDSNGFAILPLHASATRIYVGSGGNDANNGSTHALRKLTIANAWGSITAGKGDHLMLAEGTTFTEQLPLNKDGYSTIWPTVTYPPPALQATYPTVIQSYDPADPTNADKYGRATTARPILDTSGEPWKEVAGPTYGFHGLVIRGLDVNPGNVQNAGWAFWGGIDVGSQNLLIENCILRYMTIDVQGNYSTVPNQSLNVIFRHNVVYGNWSANSADYKQGLFTDWISNVVVEDNVFYHNGWKIGGAGRDSSTEGASDRRHSLYSDEHNSNPIVRRNVSLDPSATSFTVRSEGTIYENVAMRAPLGIRVGDGTTSNVTRPSGITFEVMRNAVFVDANISSAASHGWGITFFNGQSGGTRRVHHNLLAAARDIGSTQSRLFFNRAIHDQPSYALVDYNLAKGWSVNNDLAAWSTYPAQRFSTFANNIWDLATSGTNTNNAAHVGPNEYATVNALAVAAGYANEAALITLLITRPDLSHAPTLRTLLGTGYDMDWE